MYSDFERARLPSLAYWNSAVASTNVLTGITRLNGAVVSAPTTTNFVQGSFEIVSLVTNGSCRANQITQDVTYANSSWYGDIAESPSTTSLCRTPTGPTSKPTWLTSTALPLSVSTGPDMLDIRYPGNNPVFVVTAAGASRSRSTCFSPPGPTPPPPATTSSSSTRPPGAPPPSTCRPSGHRPGLHHQRRQGRRRHQQHHHHPL